MSGFEDASCGVLVLEDVVDLVIGEDFWRLLSSSIVLFFLPDFEVRR